MGWLVAGLILISVALIPAMLERGRLGPEAFRDRAPGQLAKLSQGITHYQWLGPVRGPILVCIHGLTTPSSVWYAIAQGLSMLGYRVLIYDLYGRGFSDAPIGEQDGDFFAQQLLDLLDHQEIKEDVTLMGYSMGGSIATHFTSLHPDRVRRLILLASGGMYLREDRLTEMSRKLPFVGDWLFAAIAARRDRRALRGQLGQAFDIEGIIEVQLSEYQSRGFLRSVLSSRRNILSDKQEEAHRSISRAGVPVIGIWAEKDEIIPLRSLGTLTQWNRVVRQEVVAGADHRVAYTHADEVVSILAKMLREGTD